MIRSLVILVIGVAYLLNTNLAEASGFHIKTIGNVETGGRQLSKWWYSGSRPVISGEAAPGTEVVIDIDGKALAIYTDSSGNWDFQPETLSDGDHQINISNSGSTISFVLSIGTANLDWKAVESGNVETLPTVGTSWPTILLLSIGLGLGTWGGKILPHAKI